MNSENESAETTSTPTRKSNAELIVEVLKATYVPLLVGVLCAIGLLVLWWRGVPWRPAALVLMVIFIAGPFVVCYSLLFVYMIRRKSMIPIFLVDEDQKRLGLKYLSPNEFADARVKGGSLPDRDTKAGKCYVAEAHEWHQEESVDPETGEKQTEAVRVLEVPWEGEVSSLEFIEDVKALKAQRNRLVPLAKAGLDARASADMASLENDVKTAHALIKGAEEDTFIVDDVVDPFDFDISVKDDLDDDVYVEDDAPEDDPEARESEPEPGSAKLQDPTPFAGGAAPDD